MTRRTKVLVAFGTRPEAVKMAPVLRALEADEAFDVEVLATAQHREMLDQVVDLFDLRVDHDLDIMRASQTLDELTGRILAAAGPVLERTAPDAVLVHGDTTTAFALALASFYRQIPVGHVEAGLRSGDRYAPFPEEMNRRLVSNLATWHYAPTEGNRAHLLAEGVDPARIRVTGNTVIDALLETVDPAYRFANPALRDAAFGEARVIGLTCHRRENLGAPMERIFEAVRDTVEAFPDVQMVYPVHRNPLVQEAAARILGGHPRIRLIDPLDYADFSNFMARCCFMLTDSGGVQEEAPRHLLQHVVHAEAAHAQGERQLVILGQAVARQQVLALEGVEDAPPDGEAGARRRHEAQLVAHDHGAEVVLGELVGVGGRGERLEEQAQPRHALQGEHGKLQGVEVVDQVVRHLELVGVHHVFGVVDGDAREGHVVRLLVGADGPHGVVDVVGLRRGALVLAHHAHDGALVARLEGAGHGDGGRVVGVHAQKHPVERARVLRGAHEVVHHLAEHGVFVPGGDHHGQHLRRLLVDERQPHALLADAAKQRVDVPEQVVGAEHDERERHGEADPVHHLRIHVPPSLKPVASIRLPARKRRRCSSTPKGRRRPARCVQRATIPCDTHEEGAHHGR